MFLKVWVHAYWSGQTFEQQFDIFVFMSKYIFLSLKLALGIFRTMKNSCLFVFGERPYKLFTLKYDTLKGFGYMCRMTLHLVFDSVLVTVFYFLY